VNFFIKSLLPGVFLMGLAFFAGAHSNALFGLLGFLCFFTASVTVIIEGYKKSRK